MSGSETPHLSTRLRMVFSAWSTAFAWKSWITFDLKANQTVPAGAPAGEVSSAPYWSSTMFETWRGSEVFTAIRVPSEVGAEASTGSFFSRRKSAISSARRATFAFTARSTSTPMARWMPPCRSRPRLRCLRAAGAQLGTDWSYSTPFRRSGGRWK